MTEQDLKKLRRTDLLQILLSLTRENDELRQQLDLANSQLSDRTLSIQNFGSLAEASLQLNNVFEAAQAACDQYISNIRIRSENVDRVCNQMEAEARIRCDAMIAEAKEEHDAITGAIQSECDALTTDTRAQCDALSAETRAQCDALTAETGIQCDNMLADARGQCSAMAEEANAQCEALIAEANAACDQMRAEAADQCASMIADTQDECDNMIAEAKAECDALLSLLSRATQQADNYLQGSRLKSKPRFAFGRSQSQDPAED